MADDTGQPAETDDKSPMMGCPTCKGKGVTSTLGVNAKTKTVETYGRLCIRCGGTGKIPVSKA